MATDWRLAVDIGGTFTDIVLLDAASGRIVVEEVAVLVGQVHRVSPRSSARWPNVVVVPP